MHKEVREVNFHREITICLPVRESKMESCCRMWSGGWDVWVIMSPRVTFPCGNKFPKSGLGEPSCQWRQEGLKRLVRSNAGSGIPLQGEGGGLDVHLIHRHLGEDVRGNCNNAFSCSFCSVTSRHDSYFSCLVSSLISSNKVFPRLRKQTMIKTSPHLTLDFLFTLEHTCTCMYRRETEVNWGALPLVLSQRKPLLVLPKVA